MHPVQMLERTAGVILAEHLVVLVQAVGGLGGVMSLYPCLLACTTWEDGACALGALAHVELHNLPTGLREELEVDRGVQQLIRKVEPRANRRFAVETDEPLEE